MTTLLTNLGLGKFGRNSHPVHPATVHLPLTFLLTASVLDLVTWIGLTFPALLTTLIEFATSSPNRKPLDNIALLNYLSLFSYVSTVASILTSLPALCSGAAEGYAMINANGLNLLNAKVRMMIIHALLNDVAVVGMIYNYWTRRDTEGYTISGMNALISSVLLSAVIYSAYLGGSLIYKHGVGVQRQGEGKEIKEKVMETKGQGKEQGKKEL